MPCGCNSMVKLVRLDVRPAVRPKPARQAQAEARVARQRVSRLIGRVSALKKK